MHHGGSVGMLHMASHKGYMYDAMHMYGGSVIGSHEPVEQMKVQIQGRFKNRTIARLQYLRVETSIYRKKKSCAFQLAGTTHAA